jgi:hypothetical protein
MMNAAPFFMVNDIFRRIQSVIKTARQALSNGFCPGLGLWSWKKNEQGKLKICTDSTNRSLAYIAHHWIIGKRVNECSRSLKDVS